MAEWQLAEEGEEGRGKRGRRRISVFWCPDLPTASRLPAARGFLRKVAGMWKNESQEERDRFDQLALLEKADRNANRMDVLDASDTGASDCGNDVEGEAARWT
eukprot:2299671-Pyramimonas_sp.AAC.1